MHPVWVNWKPLWGCWIQFQLIYGEMFEVVRLNSSHLNITWMRSYIKSSLFRIVVKITPNVVAKVLIRSFVGWCTLYEWIGSHFGVVGYSFSWFMRKFFKLVRLNSSHCSISHFSWALATFLTYQFIHPLIESIFVRKGCVFLSQILH